MNFDQLSVKLFGEATLYYGKFLTAVVNFLIMALIIFVMVKIVNKAVALGKKLEPKSDEKEEAPTTKICPFCKTEINIDAVRCPNCTSVLNSEEK